MGGAAKGSGMIHPNMATMLAFVTTDAKIESHYLQMALKQITNTTFNQITVDGDTSTNDMVLVLANGESGTNSLTPEHADWDHFVQLLTKCCESLAMQIAKDGEGATKLMFDDFLRTAICPNSHIVFIIFFFYINLMQIRHQLVHIY